MSVAANIVQRLLETDEFDPKDFLDRNEDALNSDMDEDRDDVRVSIHVIPCVAGNTPDGLKMCMWGQKPEIFGVFKRLHYFSPGTGVEYFSPAPVVISKWNSRQKATSEKLRLERDYAAKGKLYTGHKISENEEIDTKGFLSRTRVRNKPMKVMGSYGEFVIDRDSGEILSREVYDNNEDEYADIIRFDPAELFRWLKNHRVRLPKNDQLHVDIVDIGFWVEGEDGPGHEVYVAAEEDHREISFLGAEP